MQRRGLNVRKWFLRLIFPALRRLPPSTATRVVAGIGRAEYTLLPGLRLRFDAAVERGRDYFGAPWDVRRVGRALAGNQIRWRTRDQLLDGLDDATLARLFRVHGLEHLDGAFAERRGVVLLGSHYGAHLMPAHWVARRDYPLRLFMERPHHVSRFLRREFDSEGPLGQKQLFISRRSDPAEAARSILRATRVLRAGMVIYIAGDVRWSGAHAVAARFLGETHEFSATWAMLAALSGAPVVPTFCRMADDGTHDLEFLPAYRVPPETARGASAAAFVQGCLETIEARVAADPVNSNDYLFWTEPGAPVARSGRRPAAQPPAREAPG
jgi:lauroyl/myristoyl acyltransferase